MTPSTKGFSFNETHRLIPSKFSKPDTVLSDIADDETMLGELVLLDGATNGRILGEMNGLPGISTFEMVYGIPNAQIVNAAFTYTGPRGSRFNNSTRGAWYAADELETSIAEVSYHKARHLGEIVVPGMAFEKPDADDSTFDDWLADFHSSLHVLQPSTKFEEYLQPEPVPECYLPSQQLARQLLEAKSNGIVYPSVRRKGSTCLVCFRPTLVYNLRLGSRVGIAFSATKRGYETTVAYGLNRQV